MTTCMSPFVRRVKETPEVIEGPVARMNVAVVGDVVSVVAERRWKERQQPEAGDAKAFEIVEFLDEPWEVADAVRVAVVERLDGQLVDDRALVPEGIAFATLAGHVAFTTSNANVGMSKILMITPVWCRFVRRTGVADRVEE